MNNIIGNFVGFDGRINRQKWWIGVIILAVAGFILNWILGLVMGSGAMTLEQLMDPATMQKLGWQGLIVGIILAYPYIAITIKRRHDRNNNGYDAVGLIILGLVYNLLQALGIVGGMGNMAGGFGLGAIISLIFLVYAIYILVQVGFLKGTVGANTYGPDPLGG
jgi:uncharacterized membrane protein YhaH (DUF805 family)